MDESRANASRNGVGKVLAARGFRNVHTIIPNEREWISVLTCINANRDTIPHYYIFKGVSTSRKIVTKSIKHQQNFVDLCTISSIFTIFC